MSRCVEEIQQLDWRGFKAVLFDVDGTLYDQPMLRRKMAIELGLHYAFRPHRFREIKILSRFRHMREEYFEREEENLAEAQYDWAAKDLGISSDQVRTVIEEWIYSRPLKHLPECRPPGLKELFARLRSKGVKIGVFSDYPPREKLAALDLQADAAACATDNCVNRLKPNPAGLKHIVERLQVHPSECLHIGDREDRDAICAERFGCTSLILPAHLARELGRTKTYDALFAD